MLARLKESGAEDVYVEPTDAPKGFTRDLYELRPESDAHSAGTTDFDPAMLALHLAGSLLLYLGRGVEGGVGRT
jgi:hypothetical protein